jgi:hypothetical protein
LLAFTIPFMPRKSMEAWHSLTFYYEAMESLERGSVQDAEHWLANRKGDGVDLAFGPPSTGSSMAVCQKKSGRVEGPITRSRDAKTRGEYPSLELISRIFHVACQESRLGGQLLQVS